MLYLSLAENKFVCLGINFRKLKTTIFRENKLSRILKNRLFRGMKLSTNLPEFAKIAKVSSVLLSSLKVAVRVLGMI